MCEKGLPPYLGKGDRVSLLGLRTDGDGILIRGVGKRLEEEKPYGK